MGAIRLYPEEVMDTPASHKGTAGNMLGGLLGKVKSGERQDVHAWWLTGCAVVKTKAASPGQTTVRGSAGGGWLPILTAPDKQDDRFEEFNPQMPKWAKGEMPTGWAATVAADVSSQHPGPQGEVLLPGWYNTLIAANDNQNVLAGTIVADLDANGAPSKTDCQHLQSIFSVEDLGGGACGVSGKVISLQLGKSRLDGLSGHVPFVEHLGAAVGGVDRIHAIGERQGSGPFWSGGLGDQHVIGTDAKGNPIHPLHFQTQALWKIDATHDAPLAFRLDKWEEPRQDSGWWKRVYLRINPSIGHQLPCGGGAGLWEWETTDFWFIPEEEEEPPPPRLPEDPDPRLREDPKEEPPPVPRDFGLPDPDPTGLTDGPTSDESFGGLPGDGLDPEPRLPEALIGAGGFTGGFALPEKLEDAGLVGGVSSPLTPHSVNCMTVPCLSFKPTSVRTGERNVQDIRTPTRADADLFSSSPFVGGMSAYGAGDGSWTGWDYNTTSQQFSAAHLQRADGGIYFGGFGIDAADVLGGTYDPTGTNTTPPVKMHVVIPGNLACLDFAQPSYSNAGLTGAGVRLQQTATGMSMDALDSTGTATGDKVEILSAGSPVMDVTGGFRADGVSIDTDGNMSGVAKLTCAYIDPTGISFSNGAARPVEATAFGSGDWQDNASPNRRRFWDGTSDRTYQWTSDSLNSSRFTGSEWTDLTDGGASTLHKHDHGGQDGLADDDHSGYAWLAGRTGSGGQALYGSTAAGESLLLIGTSHGTEGAVIIGSSTNGESTWFDDPGSLQIVNNNATLNFPVLDVYSESNSGAVVEVMSINHVGNGINTGAEYGVWLVNDAPAYARAGAMGCFWTDPTAGSEDADFRVMLSVGGNDTQRLRLTSAGELQVASLSDGTNAYTLPSSAGTLALLSDIGGGDHAVSDAGTTNVPTAVTISHATSGTAAVGFGVAVDWDLELPAGGAAVEAATMEVAWTDLSIGAESTSYKIKAMVSGSVATVAEYNTGVWTFSDGAGNTLAVLEGGTLTFHGEILPNGAGRNFGSAAKPWGKMWWDDYATVGSISAPGAPPGANDGRLYNASGNLFWHPNGGSATQLGAGAPPFVDSTALVKGSADATKLWRVEVDGLTTGTTRAWTVPDADGTLLDSALAVLLDGSQGLSADWDAGAHKITAEQIESDVAIGTAPLIVTSTTVVANLNASLLEGNAAAAFAAASHTHGAADIPRVQTAIKTSAYVITAADDTVLTDATSAGFTVTLPAASAYGKRQLVIKRVDNSANLVTVSRAGGDTIDTGTSFILATGLSAVTLESNGVSVWYRISYNDRTTGNI